MSDRPATEARTPADEWDALDRALLMCYGKPQGTNATAILRWLAQDGYVVVRAEAAPRMFDTEADFQRFLHPEPAAPRAEGIPNQPTDEMKGMCAIEQRCPLPKGHKGPHEWGGPPGWRGAAPRAEGLDVERLADLEHEQWAHWKESDREWARKVLARLSRPSDERVPESHPALPHPVDPSICAHQYEDGSMCKAALNAHHHRDAPL